MKRKWKGVSMPITHLEMESYAISNTRKKQFFPDFCSFVIDGWDTYVAI